MAEKFIPNGDDAFLRKAEYFLKTLNKDPAHYGISPEDAAAMVEAVRAFGEAMAQNRDRRRRTMVSVAAKDEARLAAEKLVRKAGHLIRLNDRLSAVDLSRLGMKERPKRARRRKCPQTAPVMLFVAGKQGAFGRGGKHVIRFFDDWDRQSKARPQGAQRLELFVDLVPPGEAVPQWPGERHGGRTWYLRSFTRSPIEVEYPKSEVPMRVVYWGRWAGASGDVGPFSQTLAAPIEGMDWSKLQLTGPEEVPETRRLQQRVTITTARRELPDYVETIDRVEAESTRLLPDNTSEAA
jgi:hypothetical protein